MYVGMLKYFITHQLILNKLIIFVISTPVKVVDKGILPLEKNSIAIQLFLDIENDDKLIPCIIYSQVKRCCLFLNNEMDCDTVKLVGEYSDVLNPEDRKNYLFIYVSISQLNQHGFCDFCIDYHCGHRKVNKTEEIQIPFDTRLKKKAQYLFKNLKDVKMSHCKTADGDPLNNCKSVNCDLKYTGAKPVFDKENNRCVEAPECFANLTKDLPDIVYEPVSNTCKDLDHPLTVADIYAINSGLGVVIQLNTTQEADELMVLKPNCSTISQNVLLLKNILYGNLTPIKGYAVDFKQSCNNALMSIASSIISLSLIILVFVCCVNTLIWIRWEWKSGRLLKNINNLEGVNCEEKISRVNKDETNKLLKEVIVSDLPLELRGSVVDICERIGKEVRWKKRYRMIDVGSDINLKPIDTSDTSTTSDMNNSEKERLLK